MIFTSFPLPGEPRRGILNIVKKRLRRAASVRRHTERRVSLSATRKRYWFRLAGRCVVFIVCAALSVVWPECYAVLAILAWLVWELCFMMYPERFWDHSNAALQCSACTDKLCTQYCRKLRTEERKG